MRAGSYSENTLRAAGKTRRDGPRCFSPVHSHFVKHCNHHGVLLRTKKSSQLFQPVLTPAGIYPCCCLRSDRECVSKLPVTMDWQVEKVCVCVCVRYVTCEQVDWQASVSEECYKIVTPVDALAPVGRCRVRLETISILTPHIL